MIPILLDSKHQDFLEQIEMSVSSYGVRTLVLGNIVATIPKPPEEIVAQLDTLFSNSTLSSDQKETLLLLVKDLSTELNELLNDKSLPLLSPIISEANTEDLIIHLSIRQEEITNFLIGLNLGEGFLDDNEEHEDVMDRLELFIEEVDDLLSDIENVQNFDEYHSDLQDMIKESEEIWNETFQVLFDIL